MAGGLFGGGTGSDKNPYLIEDAADLSMIRLHPGASFKLVSNINLGVHPYNAGKGWLPIRGFHGKIFGNGKKIMNLYINRPEEEYVGFIEKCWQVNGSALRIENVMFENANVYGKEKAGIIAGEFDFAQTTGAVLADVMFSRITVTGKVKGEDYVGGLFGNVVYSGSVKNGGLMADVFVDVDITATKNNSRFGSIYGCSASGERMNGNSVAEQFTLNLDHVISASAFSNIINGSLVSSFNPYSYGCELIGEYQRYGADGKTIVKVNKLASNKTNCFFDNKRWSGPTTTNTTGVTTDDMFVKTMSDFDKRYIDGTSVWNYREGYRYPQLSTHIHDRFFVRTPAGYSVYEDGKWVVKFIAKPTIEEAYKYGMPNLKAVDFKGWDALRSEASVEILNFTGHSNGTTKQEGTVSMTMDSAASTGEKNIFRKAISFADFGDSIVTIEKGVVL